MYGAGLRLFECAELRVKDINFDRGELTVRDGKGGISPERSDGLQAQPERLQVFPVKLNSIYRGATLRPAYE